MATRGLAKNSNLLPIVVAAVAATILVVLVLSAQTNPLIPFMLKRDVSVNVVGDDV